MKNQFVMSKRNGVGFLHKIDSGVKVCLVVALWKESKKETSVTWLCEILSE